MIWILIIEVSSMLYFQRQTINLTTSADINTTISTTLEWFNETKATSFAGQDFEIYTNSIKFSIEISKYPFVNPLNSLQLIMSAHFHQTHQTLAHLENMAIQHQVIIQII
ncbi:hypothetical protein DICPUDRAFT_75546 [Dictyostelium purpureum]|uniref:ComC supersandwich domain-containing protein n=1 Tax=Dictyostelium purpureum TaxID=5786 RepID=F0ZAZ2_DICPU|nr:uncharacterized protein DICPUDRAFT_75546 [Dictyostelium purpureum]EGC38885.1 hypothetical protein DICPUDRAFT_75546 [Dictyostelium purpureum]|eukprot:XP_003284565.1 hypothetical protein DICPUDRAFT_75546 [Dictyostelium purpureum]